MNYDNPAARLLKILEAGRRIGHSEGCKYAWCSLLNITGDNPPLLMSRLGKVMELPQQIRLELQEHYPQHLDIARHWLSQVNHAFIKQELNQTWGTFISHIDVHSTNYLKMTVDLLEHRTNTQAVADDELVESKNKLQEVLDQIINSEIDNEVKKYLSRYIQKIIIAIDEYQITGALPILEGMEVTIGHAAAHQDYKSFLVDSELGKKLLDTLTSMANVVTVAVGIPQLSQTIYTLLK